MDEVRSSQNNLVNSQVCENQTIHHLNNQWVKGEKKNQRKLENTLRWMKMKMKHKNLSDAAKAVLRGKFIAVNTYFRREKRFWVNNLTFHLKKLVSAEQTRYNASRM